MKCTIFDMNFTTSVCTFKKNENDTMASYNYQLIDIPLLDEIYSLCGLYSFPPGIIFSTCTGGSTVISSRFVF
jgi:hypothetical protein